jgi:ABC-type multidrug transport system ATPase subunit
MSNNTVVSDVCRSQPDRALVKATGIKKRFGAQVVVSNVTLSCHAGEVVLILGANGAGKSTLLRIIAGLTRADYGDISIPEGVRVGFSGHQTGLYSKLSLKTNLSLYASLAGVSQVQLQELLRNWRLEELENKAVEEISRGAQSKASIIRALMASPQILLLDEPSSNLDEAATEQLRVVLSQHAALGRVALVATHDIARLGSSATRAIVMEQGAIIADSGSRAARGALESVVQQYRTTNR